MKFSKTEQQLIVEICKWANEPNKFKAFRTFMSDYGLQTGTGLIVFSKGSKVKYNTISCIDINVNTEDEYENIYNRVLFILHFISKLEKMGLITVSQGPYSENKEFCISCFSDNIQTTPITKFKRDNEYSNEYRFMLYCGNKVTDVIFEDETLDFKDEGTGMVLPYHNTGIFSRIDAFEIISSMISVEQDLFDLRERNFLTEDELMLVKAQEQLNEAKTQTDRSLWALFLSVIAIISAFIVPRCTSTNIDETQMNTFQEGQQTIVEEMQYIQDEVGEINHQQEKIVTTIDSVLNVIKATNHTDQKKEAIVTHK